MDRCAYGLEHLLIRNIPLASVGFLLTSALTGPIFVHHVFVVKLGDVPILES